MTSQQDGFCFQSQSFALGVFSCGRLPQVDVVLQFNGDLRLFTLDDQVRQYDFEEFSSLSSAQLPLIGCAVRRVSTFQDNNMPAKLFTDHANDRFVGHRDATHGTDTDSSALPAIFQDADISLPVEKTGSVSSVHSEMYYTLLWYHSQVVSNNHPRATAQVIALAVRGADGMSANSVDTRCPAYQGAEGQYRAKQGFNTLGVCNEHIPTTKVKMCSGLHGNMKSAAEMTAPLPYTEVVTKTSEYKMDQDGLPFTADLLTGRAVPGPWTRCEDLAPPRRYGVRRTGSTSLLETRWLE